MTERKDRAAALTEISLILAAVFWGLNFAATKFAAESIPPLVIAAFRFTGGGLQFLLVLRLLEPESRPGRKARMVQLSEESFVTGCEEVLSKGTSLRSGASQESAPADVRLAERHGVSSEDHGVNTGGDCRNTGEGEQAGAEERRRR